MQFTYLLASALAASVSAATFKNFVDKSCQKWNGDYVPITAAQQEEIVAQRFPSEPSTPEASYFFDPETKIICPSNSDDTYKWVVIPPWQEAPEGFSGGGGAIAVVYYNETDTYSACLYLASLQATGYAGFCN
ncbi:hypothetical protein DM02DRAFT_572478 [Periconia macrospinosa]|uniref:Uncharacterized protein n=1 Tax=Periconia macrospinosa TaxID=97972 RepID=A0A2V1D9F1_9PLEO|nr:hypothetical protein DM02DRAFT_572478 [Periconia macrospinosa]